MGEDKTGRDAVIEECARVAESCAPECDGPEYGLADEETRARMREQKRHAGAIGREIRALASAPAAATGGQWEPIASAPSADGWIGPCLFGKMQPWGWETWVGQLDAGDIWLGRDGFGGCFGCEEPTHWMPLPPAPAQGGRE